MNRPIEEIICDILQQEMGLDNQHLWVYNQNFVMPNYDDLFCMVGYAYSDVISNNNGIIENSSGGLVEIQSSNVVEYITINLVSKNDDARIRRGEVLNALSSFYSQQLQELYNFKIGRLPNSFNNVSDVEGAMTIYRFTYTFPCFVWYTKEKEISTGYGADYYDNFSTNVIIDNNGQFDFNIDSTTEIKQ